MSAIDVLVLTYCRNRELLYGTTLVFKTLRVGFPNARVTVVDNASLPEVRGELAQLARENDCLFRQIDSPGVAHDTFIEERLKLAGSNTSERRQTVFLDPDICLWRSCEDFEFDGLIAGVFVEAYDDPMLKCVTMPRLHSSFLWIPAAGQLMSKIRNIQRRHFDFRPFSTVSFKLGDVWIRYDTGASLYSAIPNQVSHFSEDHRDCFDHLYCGTHYDLWAPHLGGQLRDLMGKVHRHAKAGEIAPLKGIWREQSVAWSTTFSPMRPETDSTQ